MASRIPFSSTSHFAPLYIAADSSGAVTTTIHTASTDTAYIDELWLQLSNHESTTVRATVTKCGVSVYVDVPPKGALPLRVFDGVQISNGEVLAITIPASSGIIVDGWVNRYGA